MRSNVELRTFNFEFPVRHTPSWSAKVERWYQLDAYSYGLCEAYRQWEAELEKPCFILLASSAASNETDWHFASLGASHPARFVHTLPNIRCSPLCQMMDWHGPMLCIQKDPQTLVAALEEAASIIGNRWPRVWILSVKKLQSLLAELGCYQVFFFEVARAKGSKSSSVVLSTNEPQSTEVIATKQTDDALLEWLLKRDSREPFPLLTSGCFLVRGSNE